jgi:hypothetical protein
VATTTTPAKGPFQKLGNWVPETLRVLLKNVYVDFDFLKARFAKARGAVLARCRLRKGFAISLFFKKNSVSKVV